MARVRERLSVCPQDNPIWEEFTVREHLRFFAVCRQVSTAAVDSEVTKYCHALGLAEKLDEPCGKLSGGQKRRLWVATCLLGDCDVLLMDEPTSGMDPQARRDFWVLLKELSKTERRAVVFSTHYLEEADLLADRKVVLAAGEVRAIGTSKELKRQFGTGYWLNFALKAGAAGSKSGAVAASLSSATSGGGASGGGAGAVDTPKASQAAKSKILDFIAGRLCCSAGGGTTSEEESQRAKDAVRRSLLNVRRETRRGGASDSRLLSVCIPWDRVSRLGPLLDAIEDHLGELQIEQYSVEMTSLEEVFMRVGEEELQQRLGRRGGGTSTTSSTTGIGSPGATFPASRIAADTAEDSTSDMNLGLGTGAAATAEGNPRLGDARVAETTTGRSSSSSASDVVAVEDGLLPRALTRRRQVWATVVMKWRVFANLPTFLYVLLFYFLFIIWFFLYVGWDSASTHAEWMSLQSSEFQKRYEAFLESQEFRDKFADSVPEAFRAAESVAVAAAGAAGASSASSAAATSAATTCDEESSATLAEMLPDDARRQIRASLYPAFVADVMSGIAVRMANMVCIPIFIYCIRIIVPWYIVSLSTLDRLLGRALDCDRLLGIVPRRGSKFGAASATKIHLQGARFQSRHQIMTSSPKLAKREPPSSAAWSA